eukprot:TRINITY_DN5677_c0_g1_i3.p1 TRINITY_DN5677_c0_g1~~TRINITY_DN5677_c0_g1_i3.p1  ORF type:complete len:278 (+),score=93.90 TRINITY_DN5677_c0_g1_i3:64-834(+)
MAVHAERLVLANGLEQQVSVHRCRAEEARLPIGHHSAHIVVSEWMGYALLCESMFPSVAHIRDRYLREDGLMLPSHATLHAMPLSDELHWLSFSRFFSASLYGLDFRPAAAAAREHAWREPLVLAVDGSCELASSSLPLLHLNCRTASGLEPFHSLLRFSSIRSGSLMGLGLWFDVQFVIGDEDEHTLTLHTGPHHPSTHWEQVQCLAAEPIPVHMDESIEVEVSSAPHLHLPRAFSFEMKVRAGERELSKSFVLR